jgi:hypothetical protein
MLQLYEPFEGYLRIFAIGTPCQKEFSPNLQSCQFGLQFDPLGWRLASAENLYHLLVVEDVRPSPAENRTNQHKNMT